MLSAFQPTVASHEADRNTRLAFQIDDRLFQNDAGETVPTTALSSPLRHCIERINQFVTTARVLRLTHQFHQALTGCGAGPRSPRHTARPSQATRDPAEQPVALPAPLPWANPTPPTPGADPHLGWYVERSADDTALRAMQSQGVTITLIGPRQSGKTSLLARMVGAALARGKYVALLDLQLFESRQLRDSSLFFKQLCDAASRRLGIEPCVDAYWGDLGNSYHCTLYFEEHVLPKLDAPLLLAIDKVDGILDPMLCSDFAAMLRAWCSKRAASPLWRRLDLALVTTHEPHELAQEQQSPFNSGETIVLGDFTPEQVAELNARHGRPFTPVQQQALIGLLGGHPYLIRRALYLVASQQYTAAELLAQARHDAGPFGEHLRYQLFKLYSQPEHATALRQILEHGDCDDARVGEELRGAGMVRFDSGRWAARCRLYALYFRPRLQ